MIGDEINFIEPSLILRSLDVFSTKTIIGTLKRQRYLLSEP